MAALFFFLLPSKSRIIGGIVKNQAFRIHRQVFQRMEPEPSRHHDKDGNAGRLKALG
jgi:hypothetical protein